ncbi:hypothetical protein [Aeromonas veronii]|uniref:hypothetical protein n=1 Tax=Aeromonas veronii TaxID=654 RepID=UPI003DA6607F
MELKAHYPTVYIDAWQQDFSDDPLLTVISSIIEQLKAEAGSTQLSPLFVDQAGFITESNCADSDQGSV